MSKSNISNILKSHFDFKFNYIVLTFSILFLYMFFLSNKIITDKEILRKFSFDLTVILSFLIYNCYLGFEEKISFIISGCSRKELLVSEFITHLLISVSIILMYFLTYIIIYGFQILNKNNINNIHLAINIKGVFITLMISSFISNIASYFDIKENDTGKKSNTLLSIVLYMIGYMILGMVIKIITSKIDVLIYGLNIHIYIMAYLILLIILYMIKSYFIEKKDFKL